MTSVSLYCISHRYETAKNILSEIISTEPSLYDLHVLLNFENLAIDWHKCHSYSFYALNFRTVYIFAVFIATSTTL